MPPVKSSKKPAVTSRGIDVPVKAPVEAPPSNGEQELRYPELYISGLDAQGKRVKINPVTYLTGPQAIDLIGYETDTQYRIEQARLHPGTKPEDPQHSLEPHALFKHPFTDEWIRCQFNGRNRPFDMPYTLAYLQDMANRKWAGTLGTPWDTVNGETCIIGSHGNVISAQKRIVAFIFLWEIWHRKTDPRHERVREMWPEEPTFPCILVFGVSEHPSIVRTLDNVQPRSETDIVFTSGMFDNLQVATGLKAKPHRNPTDKEKKELSKMMAKATDMLWRRTGVKDAAENVMLDYQTHAESTDFMSRHGTLRKCVAHLFTEDGYKESYEEVVDGKGKTKKRKIRERGISQLGVSPGECAGLMYMMACSGAPCEQYHLTNRRDRTEELLDFDRYDKAAQFVALLADKNSSVGSAINEVKRPRVGEPADEFGGDMFTRQEGGNREERMAVIAKAWSFWIAGEDFDAETLRLGYRYKHNKGNNLITEFEPHEKIKVGGIDLGEPENKKEETVGEVATTDYIEVPAVEEEVYDGPIDEEEVEEAVEEMEEARRAEAPLEETPEQERARRAAQEKEEPGRVTFEEPKKKPIKRK